MRVADIHGPATEKTPLCAKGAIKLRLSWRHLILQGKAATSATAPTSAPLVLDLRRAEQANLPEHPCKGPCAAREEV